MSWAGPEDIYLSTSLASYLDTWANFCFLPQRNSLYCYVMEGNYWGLFVPLINLPMLFWKVPVSVLLLVIFTVTSYWLNKPKKKQDKYCRKKQYIPIRQSRQHFLLGLHSKVELNKQNYENDLFSPRCIEHAFPHLSDFFGECH